jgi:hypothetical protein
MCLRRAPEKYIAGAALVRAAIDAPSPAWTGTKQSKAMQGSAGQSRQASKHEAVRVPLPIRGNSLGRQSIAVYCTQRKTSIAPFCHFENSVPFCGNDLITR